MQWRDPNERPPRWPKLDVPVSVFALVSLFVGSVVWFVETNYTGSIIGGPLIDGVAVALIGVIFGLIFTGRAGPPMPPEE